ncbi:MAG: hypothetical protein AMS26_06150 [Bacteroides sp. SM23_62]|nr:MAG: hypothetical protein AMS26_06150 [Bacteroides sp. SM23_62]
MIIVLGIFAIPATAFMILQNSRIQTYLAKRIATTISENLQADFSIESMDMILFNRVVLKEVMLKDQYLDTLLYAPSMIATLKTFSPTSNRIELSRLKFEDATIRLSTDTTRTINLKFITQALKKPPDSTKVRWKVTIHNIDFARSRFKYENHFNPREPDYGVNFTDMDFAGMDLQIKDLRVLSDSVQFLIKRLGFRDKSGCVMHDLSALMSLNRAFMKFKDLHIILDDSDIRADRLDFTFNSWKDFGNKGFSSKVKLNFNFLPCRINMADAAYWASFLHGIDKTVNITGTLRGRLNSFKGENILLEYGNHTVFRGNFDLNGLPDIQETFMYFDIRNLTTTVADIESFQKPGEPGETVDLSEQFSHLGDITYHGKFAGFYNDFVSYGTLITDVGQLSTDLSIRPDPMENVHFSGKLNTEDFDLARLTDLGDMAGKLSMNAQVEGTSYQGGSLGARMDGHISKVEFNKYEYQHINFQGDLSNRKFDGSFSVRDPNLQMEFFGKLDINDTLPVFDFTANVDRARLYPLNLATTDPTYTLSCYLRANFRGSDIDEFDGEINLVNSLFQKQDKQIQIYNFNLYAQHRPDSNRMILKSDLVDAEINGQYEFEDIGKATGRLLAHHLPAFRDIIKKNPDPEDESFNNFRYEFHLKNTYPITDFFSPEIEFARNSKIYGNYNPAIYEFNLEGDLPSFRYNENTWDNLEISLVTNDSTAHFRTTCGSMVSGSVINMENIRFHWDIDNDSLIYSLLWDNKYPEDISKGDISGFASFLYRPSYKIPRMDIHFNPGRIFIRDTIWDLDQSGITIDTSSVEFHGLRISHNTQSLAINGTLSRQPADELHFNFTDLDLEHLNQVTSKSGLNLDGILIGTSTISDVYNNPMLLSDINIDHLIINGEELGNTTIHARWINPEQKIRLEMEAMRGKLKTVDISGDYFPENRKINFVLALDKLKLEIFEPYTRGMISDLEGLASGQLQIGGYTDKPMVNGSLNMQKTSLRVEYLQAIYSFTNDIEVRDNNLIIRDFELFDETGNRSVMEGMIKNRYFRDFDFDLSLRADNFNFLRTREIHNQSFYGDAMASGLVRFVGQPGNLRLVVSAKTEKGTHIFIPINQGRDLQENNFITFIQPDSLVVEEEEVDQRYTVDLTGLRLDFDLEVTQDATVEIIFDPKVGDIMSANGAGNIKLTIDPQNDFEIFGEYIIDRGDYLFTLQNIINKRLSVQQGGRITWNGDPTGAVIKMNAIYDTRAVPGVLVPQPPENLQKRMPVQCHLVMEGNLLNPLLSFKIEMPTAEEETRNVVRNAISTEEELTKQFLSLLVINNFSAPINLSGGSGTTGAGMAGVTASELLSNQLSNWLSQISNDFDIGVNYRPGDEISSDQVEVALSTQIFDDRVTIHTNVDVSDKAPETGPNQRTNTIAGDFDVDVKLTDNGKIRLKAFNRYNYDQLYNSAPYTQGVGFVYREDFNSFGELGRRYLNVFRGSKKKKKDKEKKNVSDSTTDIE